MRKNKLANFKRIVYIVLVMLVFSFSLSLVACSKPNDPPSTGSGSGTGETNGTTGETTGESGANNPYSQYSELLQGVLTSDYYNGLIAQAKANYSDFYSDFYETANFDPHPYAFLEEQGHDINAIKNGTLTCYTVSFEKDNEPNDLYIAVNVETPSSYYTQYVLKYSLTEKEMSEYDRLHQIVEVNKHYIQAVFMNDAISNSKQANIVSKINVDKDAYFEMNTEISDLNSTKDLIGTNSATAIFKSVDKENCEFDVFVIPYTTNNTKMFTNGKIAIYPLKSSKYKFNYNNNIFIGPTDYDHGFYIRISEYDKNSGEKATIYHSHTTWLTKDLRDRDTL